MTLLGHLLPVNAVLALLQRDELWPPLLHDAGFRLAGIEIPVRTPLGNLTLDVVAVQEATNHLLVVEAKSGRNVEVDQARKLMTLAPAAVAQNAKVTLAAARRPTVEVVYACLGDEAEAITANLRAADLDPPVLSVGEGELRRAGGGFQAVELREAFELPTNLPGPPPRVIRYDQHTTAHELVAPVLAELVASQSHRMSHVTLPMLTELVVPLYAVIGSRVQQALRHRIQEAVQRIVSAHPGSFGLRRGTGSPDQTIVEIRSTPEDYDQRGRTQGYQRLARHAAATPPADGDQRTIFELLDEELDALEEADEVDEASDEGEEA